MANEPAPKMPTPAELLGSVGNEYLLAGARASAWIYRYHGTGSLHESGWAANLVHHGPTQVALLEAKDKSCRCIVFRGSDERGDWLDNFDIRKVGIGVPWYTGSFADIFMLRSHAGIARQLGRVIEEAEDFVGDAEVPVFVFGHSLGAGMAHLFHAITVAKLTFRGRFGEHESNIRTVGYNGPRVLSEESASWANDLPVRPKRVVTALNGVIDLVPRVPKRSWGFSHYGDLVIFDEIGSHSGANAYKKWRAMREANPVGSLPAWRIISRLSRGVKAHRWRSVIELIDRASSRAMEQ